MAFLPEQSHYPSAGVSIPESDLRNSGPRTQQGEQPFYDHAHPYGGQSSFSAAAAGGFEQDRRCQHSFMSHDHCFTGGDFGGSIGNGDNFHGDYGAFPGNELGGGAVDARFSHIAEEDRDFAAALANYQPCDDCTPSTQTTIPHHHHPSGRLAGASATLAGHFCCSWIVHDQPCFLCFESAEALDNHIKNDHAGKDGTYRCLWQDCAKHDNTTNTSGPMNFGNKPKLMRHVHSHTGYKPFPCPFPDCDKGFVTKEQLRNHETTHTKSRKYQCEFCSKAFAVKSALTTHITAVHDEKKTHKCDVCGKAFADSSNLSKHKQTHFRPHAAGVRKRTSRRTNSTTASTRSTPSISTPSVMPTTPYAHLPDPSLLDFQMPPPASNTTTTTHPYAYSHMTAPTPLPYYTFPPPASSTPTATTTPTLTNSTPSAFSALSSAPDFSLPGTAATDPALDDCYCCDARCPVPEGPVTPCEDDGCCDRDGFCDLPDCLEGEEGVEASDAGPAACPDGPKGHCPDVGAAHCHGPVEGSEGWWEWGCGNDESKPGKSGCAGAEAACATVAPLGWMGQREVEEEFTNMHCC